MVKDFYADREDPESRTKKVFKRKPLTKKQLAQIKRMLNIPIRAPFKKCPAKNKAALKRLEEKGEDWHRARNHAPCEECSCQNVAGLGTNHYGYGWCYKHERSFSQKDRDQMANADLMSQQQRHPRHFRDATEYLAKVQEEGEAIAEDRFDLTGEMVKAQSILNDMHGRISGIDKDREAEITNIVTKIDEMTSEIKTNQSMSPDDRKRLEGRLDEIVERLTCPLTEKGKGGPVEMCDATKYTLQMQSGESLTRIAERTQKLMGINMISEDSFKEWLMKFHQNLKKEFSTVTYTTDQGTFEVMEGVGEAANNTGMPRKGL